MYEWNHLLMFYIQFPYQHVALLYSFIARNDHDVDRKCFCSSQRNYCFHNLHVYILHYYNTLLGYILSFTFLICLNSCSNWFRGSNLWWWTQNHHYLYSAVSRTRGESISSFIGIWISYLYLLKSLDKQVILEAGWSFGADIWSIGCIIAEILDGELLFGTVTCHSVYYIFIYLWWENILSMIIWNILLWWKRC
jgi:hypothetical protein